MRQHHLRALVLAAFTAAMLAAPAGIARADTPRPGTADGPRLLLKYASCALSLAFADSPVGAFGALLACGKVLLDELPR